MNELEQSKSPKNSKWLEFFELTSLHGYGYLFRENKPMSHTIGWVCVIIASMSCLSVLMYMNIDEFVRSSVSFNLESATAPLSEVFFPSMVICNMNKLRKSFIYSLIRDPALSNVEYHDLLRIVDQVFIEGLSPSTDPGLPNEDANDTLIIDAILGSQVYNDLFDESFSQSLRTDAVLGDIPVSKWHFLMTASINNETRNVFKRSSMVELAAQFRDRDMITQVDFGGYGAFYAPALHTDISETCVWLTPYWEKPDDPLVLSTVRKNVLNGANNGFRILLDAESYDYGSSLTGTEGFFIAILHHLDIPIMKNSGIQIETGQSVLISVTPSIINTTLPCKRRFTPEKRQCYFDDEIHLRHFPPSIGYRYEMSNCLFEATLQKVEQDCGCISAKYRYNDQTYPICEGAQKKCMKKHIDLMGTERYIDDQGEAKLCLAACEDQKHSFMVTSAGYPNAESFHLSSEFCLVLNKIRNSCAGDRIESLNDWDIDLCPTIQSSGSWDCASLQNNEAENITDANLKKIHRSVAKYAKRNMARVNIFIGDSYVKKFLTEEKITEISFVGNIGGLMGLFVGFSFISVVEFLYYFLVVGNCTSRVCKSKRRKRKTNTESKGIKIHESKIDAWT